MGALSVGRELGGGEETVQGSIRGRLGAARSLIGMDGLDQQARRIRMTRSQRRRVDPFAVSQSIPRPTQGHKATVAANELKHDEASDDRAALDDLGHIRRILL